MFQEAPSLWIFGYGSLIWNPGFAFSEKIRAYALGYTRRMYQGNTHHRGDDKLPGRVATLVKKSNGVASGLVFRVTGIAAISRALDHLQEREVNNGYEFRIVRVTSAEIRFSSDSSESYQREFLALTCIATSANALFLGPARTSEVAMQIKTARGVAGPNHEYVLKLAEHIRELFPQEEDAHLFRIEKQVRHMMGSSPF